MYSPPWKCPNCGWRNGGLAKNCCWCLQVPPVLSVEQQTKLEILRHRVQSGELWGDTRGYFELRLEWLRWLWRRGLA